MIDLNNKKILITGASGFIGSHLCDAILKKYPMAIIHAISRKKKISDNHITWWQADVSDQQRIDELFATLKPDIVFHLASEVTGIRDMEYVIPTMEANLVSTIHLLVAATKYKTARMVTIGSVEEPDASEDFPCSPYAAAKFASTQYAKMFHNLYGTPVVHARLFMVYGPAQQDTKKLVPYVISSLLAGETPHFSNGVREVDWVYVDDVVNGLLDCAVTPGIEGKTIDIGTGKLTSVKEVVEMLFRLMKQNDKPSFGTLPTRAFEKVKKADIQDSFKKIGWKPKISLEQGLSLTINWYKNQL